MRVSLGGTAQDVLPTRSAMTRVVLSSKYQIVIPQDVRLELGLQPGQEFDVLALGGRLHVVPARSMSDIIGLYPGIDTSVVRDDKDRL
jgi:AbrB family looped-hinge helix DNA binding protein